MKLRFIRSEHEIGNVYSYFFEQLEAVTWQAGQYLNISLPGVAPVYADRLFTIASAPHEGHVQITTLVTESPFKQKLRSLKPNDVVVADQLGGDFVWQDDGRKKLYMAGGIGITPFRSIILDQIQRGVPNDATLLYGGNQDQQPFVDLLLRAEKDDSSLKLHIITNRRITLEDISLRVPDVQDRLIYIAGPQTFVEGFGEYFMKADIPRSQIKYDWFDGYYE